MLPIVVLLLAIAVVLVIALLAGATYPTAFSRAGTTVAAVITLTVAVVTVVISLVRS
ncbi:hypothetical protein R2B67_09065 [Streptomyces cyaneofuscatus]|uniref:hypothetical protein n=1 Tax=Streptomyces cyaneofuscatus TaxID=66883 RepID=UPI002955D7B9|nr:hypothetical protein [Streptomyces cyaneofuscatus]WOP08698.1 hypothetical protein R2B67_09065 [Streptomyces cyaneofuscatus]